jgi:ADP-ribose pyrophosphatase YjhB (NUDIX family)
LISTLKRAAFWIVARTCFTLYRWFPLFGSLRAAIGIIQRDETFLVIDRADGQGLSLPGGIAAWREPEETTLRREVREETGLEVTHIEFRLRFHSTAGVPVDISVYAVVAKGELRQSWEGSPHWMTLKEIEPRLMKSQRPVLQLLAKTSTATGGA